MRLAKQQSLILVVQLAKLRRVAVGQYPIDVAQLAQHFALLAGGASATLGGQRGAQVAGEEVSDENAGSEADEAEDEFLRFEQVVDAADRYFDVDFGLLDLNQQGADEVAADGAHEGRC